MSEIASMVRGRRQLLQCLAVSVLGVGSLPLAQAAAVSDIELQRALEKLLKEKPELVRDALNTLEQREAAARLRADQALLKDMAPSIHSEAGATVLGNPMGDVTLVEFIDYRCGYCKQMQGDIYRLIDGDRQLRVLVKHLPILGPESLAAARLVLSAGQGPAAIQLHRRLMETPQLDAVSLARIKPSSEAKGLDAAAVERGLNDVKQLAGRLNIQGTPALLVGDHLLRGAAGLEALKAAIQTTRADPTKNPPKRA